MAKVKLGRGFGGRFGKCCRVCGGRGSPSSPGCRGRCGKLCRCTVGLRGAAEAHDEPHGGEAYGEHRRGEGAYDEPGNDFVLLPKP